MNTGRRLSKEHIAGQIGLEVLTAVIMKISILRDITSCSRLKVNRRFGGTYGLHGLLTDYTALYPRT
jgi:hypothetical protein